MKPLARTLALLLTASTLYLASAPASARVDVTIGINVPPPVQIVEITPQPRHGYIWAPGYWRWHDHRHVWVEGRWLKARPGHVWVSERWERRDDHHHFVPGRWDRDPHYKHGRGHGHGHGHKHHERNW